MATLIELVRHLDQAFLERLADDYGAWLYAILFAIVLLETGLVVTPFLPGDSLLFLAGAVASSGKLDIWLLGFLLMIAAVAGDTMNYHLGYYFGPRVLRGETSRWLNRKHLVRTQEFFDHYGGKTIILARFVPIVRTFAPFVAGVGAMRYRRFLSYNVIGGVIWVAGFLGAGYWFGSLPIVQRYFQLVIVGIIVVSILPAVFEIWRARRARAAQLRDQTQ